MEQLRFSPLKKCHREILYVASFYFVIRLNPQLRTRTPSIEKKKFQNYVSNMDYINYPYKKSILGYKSNELLSSSMGLI